MKVTKFLMHLSVFCLMIASCFAQNEKTLFKPDVPFSGRVLTPKGEPVKGARVSCVGSPKGDNAKIKTLASVQTDAEGRYLLDIPAIIKSGAIIRNLLIESDGWGTMIAHLDGAKDVCR